VPGCWNYTQAFCGRRRPTSLFSRGCWQMVSFGRALSALSRCLYCYPIVYAWVKGCMRWRMVWRRRGGAVQRRDFPFPQTHFLHGHRVDSPVGCHAGCSAKLCTGFARVLKEAMCQPNTT
jgi:hypothetical protein